MSAILDDALTAYRWMREDFELHRRATFIRAHTELRGELLNARGRISRIDPYSLFMGPQIRVSCYASEELEEWFEHHGRLTVEEFEAQWWTGRDVLMASAGRGTLREIA